MTGKADVGNFLYSYKTILAVVFVAVLVSASTINVAFSNLPTPTVATYNNLAGVRDCSYIITTNGVTTYAQNCNTGSIDYSGTNTVTVIESAFSALTAGRTWKETVVLVGSFTASSQIDIPSYTRLVIDGQITQAAGTTLTAVIKNKNAGVSTDSNIEITGGIIDGNKDNGASAHGIQFDGVTNSTIHDITVKNAGAPAGRNIYITTANSARVSQGIQLDNIFTTGASDSNIELGGTQNGSVSTSVKLVTLTNIISTNAGERGIAFTNVHNSTLSGAVIYRTTNNRGLDVGYGSTDNVFSNINIGYTKLSGLVVATSPGSVPADRNTFANVRIYNASRMGVEASASNLAFTNLNIAYSGQYGIQCTCNYTSITNSVIRNNGQNTANTFDGLFLRNGRYDTVTGIVATDDQTSKTQRYGILISNAAGGSSLNNLIANNVVANNTQTAGISNSGTGTIIRNNIGYVTENKGTATINSGSTSAVVTHGLSYTPSAGECTVTWTENPTNDPGNWWLSSITSSQFTVNVRSDPGASNLDFSWACRKI